MLSIFDHVIVVYLHIQCYQLSIMTKIIDAQFNITAKYPRLIVSAGGLKEYHSNLQS